MIATVLRLIMIAFGWPGYYNDEGTVGLMARHIAYQGAHPLLYYGQDYMGSLEAYLGAGFFHLFGSSTFALRLGLLLLFALFLLCMYHLTTLLYSKSLALFSLAVLALGSPDVIFRQLMAAGGPPDYFFFTALLLLLTAWLALTSTQLRHPHDTDYDDCNRMAFISNERIICAALDNGLQPSLDRYFPYRQMVAEAPHPFYLFFSSSAQAFLFEQKATSQGIAYKKTLLYGYTLYEPEMGAWHPLHSQGMQGALPLDWCLGELAGSKIHVPQPPLLFSAAEGGLSLES